VRSPDDLTGNVGTGIWHNKLTQLGAASPRALTLSLGPEEPLENFSALDFPHPTGDQALVIQRRHLEQIDHSARSSGFRIRATVDHPAEPGLDDRSRAHWARFFSDIEIAVVEPPVVDHAFGLSDREHLCVRGGILQDFDLVPGACDDFCITDNHGADRNFILRFGSPCLPQSFAHKIGIARKIQQIVHDKG